MTPIWNCRSKLASPANTLARSSSSNNCGSSLTYSIGRASRLGAVNARNVMKTKYYTFVAICVVGPHQNIIVAGTQTENLTVQHECAYLRVHFRKHSQQVG